MPPLVAIEDLTVVFATRAILDSVTLGIEPGQRIGVVGRNGDGKSTLLRTLAGLAQPDAGRVVRGQGVRVVLLAQSDASDPRTVRAVTVGDRADHLWAADQRVRAILTGLLGGVLGQALRDGLDTPLSELSGGERRRVALAAALIDPGDVLLLDEPTNHLDVSAVAWLAEHLRGPQGPRALAVVTHDRWFLDAVCTQTWEVVDAAVHRYEGGYAAWVLARAERERRAAVAEERRRNLVRKELAWLRRGPPARTSKPQFRIDAATALVADVPEPRDRLALRRLASARLGRQVVDCAEVTIRTPDPSRAGRTLLSGLTWQLGPGDRVGLLGPNGAGKTSLARVLLGQRAPDGGQVVIGSTVVPAMLAQHVVAPDPDDRVLPSIQQVRREVSVDGRTLTAGTLLEDFGFRGERLMTRLGDLSGGELRRVELLRLLLAGPNLIVLDEPTNDLDIDTLTAVEDLLDTWPGTLLVISHDRYFLERTCDDVYAMLGDGTLRHLPRGVDEYLDLLAARATPAKRATPAARSESLAPGPAPTATSPGPTGAALRAARKDLGRVEARLARLEQERATVHDQMASAHSDHERLAVLVAQEAALAAERDTLEERWLELAQVLEG